MKSLGNFDIKIEDILMWNILLALLIILLTIVLKRAIIKLLIKLLNRLTKNSKGNWMNKLFMVLDKPLELAFVTFAFYIALKLISFPVNIGLVINNIAKTIVLFTIFWAAYRIANVFDSLYEVITEKTDKKLDGMVLSFLKNGIKIVIVIIGSITILQVWFKELGGLLAGLGLGGLAFALAAQETAANLFGGIAIMSDRPFEIGDWIQTPSVEGTVEEIGFRSTRIRTVQQTLVTIPNSVLSKEVIRNWSKMGKRLISYRLGLVYNTGLEQLKACLEEIRKMLKEHPEVHPETIYVYFERFGESSLDIFIHFFTKATERQKYLEVQEDVNLKILEILNKLEISIAFPSRTIYVEKTDKK
ncbi:MAG TPA: mechanosensitive ion channel family protein [Defluviitaleaceae bacterium]|nr:mechanosensitive ion channel family protein [Defluviitaleaceae bacterium]HPT76800.1 mechanosensitive ion channel family protein [Defluviitaleaceae bacterium]HQD49758.1 mechanosensitive ion channel family protein [Defluviitaleaceae bacterium]